MINPILKPMFEGGFPMIAISENITGGSIWVSLDGGLTWDERSSTFSTLKPNGIAIGGDIRNIVVTGYGSSTADQFTAFAAEDGSFSSYSGGYQGYARGSYASYDGTCLYSFRTHTSEAIAYSINGGASWALRTGYGDQPVQIASSRDNLTVWVAHDYTTHKYLRKFTNGMNNTASITVTPFGAGRHNSVACSGDGKYVYAGEGYITSMKVAVSSDYGSTWSIKTLGTGFTSTGSASRVFCNESGQYVLAQNHGSTPRLLKLSSDYGQTWSTINLGNYRPFFTYSSPISKSGKYMVIGELTTKSIYHISSDFGQTWNTVSAPSGYADATAPHISIQDPISGSSGVIQTSISTLTSVLTSKLTSTSWNTTVGSVVNTTTNWATVYDTSWNTLVATSRVTNTSYNTVAQTSVDTSTQTWSLVEYQPAQWMTVEFPTHWNTLKSTILGATVKSTTTSWNTSRVTTKSTGVATSRLTATGGGSQVATSRDTTTSWNTDKTTTTSWNTSE